MAIESAYRSVVNLRLIGGYTGSGGMVTRTVSLRNVLHGADKDKIMSVIGAMLPVLLYPMYRVERQEITVIEN